ncbi:MAG: YbaK/EbsC family protein [Candidatus Krumholzibacteriia bacterium]
MESSEAKVLEALRDLGVPHEVLGIDPEFADTAAFCERYGYPLEHSCNAILVATKKEPKRYVACLVLAHTRLDVNHRVKTLLGERASFASPEEMRALTGMQVGGVTPLALPPGVPLYVDARIMDLDWVIVGAGGRSSKIKLAPATFEKLGAEVVEDLAVQPSD